MRVLVLLSLLGFALASEDVFLNFAKEFNKSYKDGKDLVSRRAVFMNNYEKMVKHNERYEAGQESWAQKVHEDMDLTSGEWMSKRTGGLPVYDENTKFTDTLDERIVAQLKEMKGNPMREFAWGDEITSVKNQAQCGSCAAFSVIGAVESCFNIQRGYKVDDLSEQHILDCAYNYQITDESGTWGAYGCDGAWPNAYIDWLMGKQYNQMESSYPYTSGSSGDVGSCKATSDGVYDNAWVTGMYNVWFCEENDMENLVMINPVSTSLQATANWGGYSHGVLDDPACCDAATDSNCVYTLNHAILVIGYGHDSASGLDYWLIKNSWGSRWGDSGYMKLKKGTGHCGVGSLHQTIPHC